MGTLSHLPGGGSLGNAAFTCLVPRKPASYLVFLGTANKVRVFKPLSQNLLGRGAETKSASSITKPSPSPSVCASSEQSLIPALSSTPLSLRMTRRAWQGLPLSLWPEEKSL